MTEDQLLTETVNNEFYWGNNLISLQNFYDSGLISEKSFSENNNRQAVVSICDNEGKGKDGFYLAPGGKMNLKIVASRLISNLNDIIDLYENENITEVLVYSNISSRRMIKYKSNNNYALYPGDTQDTDCSLEATNDAYILPPTGEILKNKNMIIAITALAGIIIIVIAMLKKRK